MPRQSDYDIACELGDVVDSQNNDGYIISEAVERMYALIAENQELREEIENLKSEINTLTNV